MRIARQFTAGSRLIVAQVPKGRSNPRHVLRLLLFPLRVQHKGPSAIQEKLIKYIENQEPHHRKMSFQDEFVALLKKHNIEYEERYLWSDSAVPSGRDQSPT